MTGVVARHLFLLLLAIMLAVPALAGANRPDTIVLSPDVLYQTKRKILHRDPTIRPVYDRFISEAKLALDAPLESVTFKKKAGPSNDVHDYWSLSPDWWPNPTTQNGLPYKQQPGKANPEAASDRYDHSRLSRMTRQALTLALAWYFTGNELYSSKSTAFIMAWCGDASTRTTPNMLFAHSRPGVADGHHTGIIETRDLIRVVDAARILEPSHAWSKTTSRKIKKWFSDYVQWLMHSEFGRREAESRDHHGTWFDAQVAVYALYSGNTELARTTLGTVHRRRIARQIMPDGSMPYELKKQNSRDATFSALEAYFVLASTGERVGLDLWTDNTQTGPSIRQALNFAASDVTLQTKRPYGTTEAFDPYRYVPLFRRAALVYKDNRHLDYLNELPESDGARDRSILFY